MNYFFLSGGRLKCFLIYDLIIFLWCALAFALLYFLDDKNERKEWKTKSYFYMIRMFYGLLSFPFLIFSIPLLNTILTKSRPTGYDQ